MSLSDADLNRIAYTMLGEARPNDPAGMAAVGNVIMNRYAAGGWYGSTIEKITRPSQFATWAPKDQGGNDPVGRFSTSSAAFQRAKALAQQLANGEIPDNTGGALSYRAASAGTNFAGG
jgi:spore germination cell wall hydrolase CwlJ-like protein